MDPVTISAAVVAAVSPYLGKVADKFAEKAGEAAFKGVGALYETLKKRVQGTPAEEALHDLERSPGDPDNQGDLRKSLRKLLEAQPGLADELAELVKAAAPAGGASFSTHIAGDVKNVIQGQSISIDNLN